MKSLQVVTPHKECIYDCKFCISKMHKHDNKFVNNYELNKELWKNNLIKIIKENKDLKYVVITGTNEPMQSEDCVRDIIDVVRSTNKEINIEIQTHFYKENSLYNDIDVVAYSISNPFLLDKIIPSGKISRYVLILTDSFNNYKLDDILKLIPKNVTQITFKSLQLGEEHNKVYDYILNHSISKNTFNKLKENINNYKGNLSIRLDNNCMDSINRYKIYREDGNLYDSWSDD